ncbi:LacI family DNA-binding transcriptional regulator [Rhodococcus sp. MEB041]|uniref:LacI family DNA-binding transcriptional regulator n=1 Tax=Rhodococcus sp. MEB041 TaxID=3040323 RepID=UPI00254BA3D1|nr:LacI family DNA-binding transcriptional regulator [Rhodococcus sp. MEB041]
MSERTTSADVATAAGVSRATVSYVLNNRVDKQISESTRRKVLDAALQLDYNPSPAARALRRGTGDIVVALVPHTWDTSEPIARLLAGVGTALSAEGLAFLRHPVGDHPGHVRDLLRSVTAACVVTFQRLSTVDQASLETLGVREIRAWVLQSASTRDALGIGQLDMVRTQVQHVIDIGCEKLVYVADRASEDDDFVRARRHAFDSLTRESDHATTSYLTDDAEADLRIVESWTDSGRTVGVCAFSDVVAGRVLHLARNANVSVPRQLAVIGVDDAPFSPYLVPPLSTVGYDLTREARRIATDVLHSLGREVEGQSEGDRETVSLIRRASTTL